MRIVFLNFYVLQITLFLLFVHFYYFLKGNVRDIIKEVNGVLKGQGHVSFVAVKGSGQVARVTEETFVPVPQDLTGLFHHIY